MSQQYWGALFHLGYNFWFDEDSCIHKDNPDAALAMASPRLRFEKPVWDELTTRLAAGGGNMLVIDLGEGVQYESHPEIAAEGAWTVDELRAELARLRALGITPIPKLNFSLTHNKWLGPYKRMATSDIYNKVCVDLIHEVCDIFDTPPMFHLGMDEEEAPNQINMQFAVYRQFDLWWSDLYRLFDACNYKGVRPALWADYGYNHLDEYLKRMSKDAVQFTWYYGNFWGNVSGNFIGLDKPKYNYKDTTCAAYTKYLKAMRELDKAGFDQIPTTCIKYVEDGVHNISEYSRQVLSPDHVLGFMQTIWRPTMQDQSELLNKAVDSVIQAKAAQEAR